MQKRFLQMMKKRAQSLRLFSLLLCLGMLIPAVGWGQEPPVGEGTEDKPYQIETAEDLIWFRDQVNNNGNTTACAVLIKDIDLNPDFTFNENGYIGPDGQEPVEWMPIGNHYNPLFKGIFDGNGHTVSGIYINNKDNTVSAWYHGLFGMSGGTIKNVGVINSYIISNLYAGGVCGYNNEGEITQCYNIGTIIGEGSIGGVCGFSCAGKSKISDCYNTGAVKGMGDGVTVGGVCGENLATISDCYNAGTVTGTGGGVIVGGVCGESSGDITDCGFLQRTEGNQDLNAIGSDEESTGSMTVDELVDGLNNLNGFQGNASYQPGVGLTLPTLGDEEAPTVNDGLIAKKYKPYLLTITESANGTVTATPNGCLYAGTKVILKVEPEEGYQLTSLKANKTDVKKDEKGDYTFLMPTENINVTATFALIPPTTYTVTVEASPLEGGTVTGGGTYTENTTVTLTATANAGYEFVKWRDGEIKATRTITVTKDETYTAEFKKVEEPTDPEPPVDPDPISYYNIYVEEVCDGAEVTTSKNVVREGGSVNIYVEKDTANYTFDNFKVYIKRSYYGYWEEVKEGMLPGEYLVKNIWTNIYVKAEGAEKKEDPTGIESIEGVKVYTQDGGLYVQTPQREVVVIVSMSGAVVKNEEQVGLKQYHGLQRGIYIVRVGDRVYKLRLN